MLENPSTSASGEQVERPPVVGASSENRGKRGPVVCRRVDVAALETARFEKSLSILDLCLVAEVDPAAYRHLLRWEGMRSRDRVIAKVVRALGLRIRDVVVFKREGEEAA